MQQLNLLESFSCFTPGDNGVENQLPISTRKSNSEHFTIYSQQFRNTELGSKILRDMDFEACLEDFGQRQWAFKESGRQSILSLMDSVPFQGLYQI